MDVDESRTRYSFAALSASLIEGGDKALRNDQYMTGSLWINVPER